MEKDLKEKEKDFQEIEAKQSEANKKEKELDSAKFLVKREAGFLILPLQMNCGELQLKF